MKKSVWGGFGILLALAAVVWGAEFTVDLAGPASAWPHFWEECVGSCHAPFALQEDWRAHVLKAATELGIRRVRFHGIFDDDMSVVLPSGTYSFLNVDRAFDWLLRKAHVAPLVELSFMPELLARNASQTIFHYKGIVSPPRSQDAWGSLIKAFAAHLVARYGADQVASWLFEVWNEPNIDFWSGTQADYFELLETTYRALKSVDSRIQVGGPATAQSCWLPETLAFARSRGLELSFVSTHEYPSDPGQPAPKARDNMKQVFAKARREVGNGTRLMYTEFNSGLDEPHHDDPFAAAFLIHTVADAHGIVDVLSYWSVSDLFEEGGQDYRPFQQQFGLLTVHGVPKPAFRAMQLLHWTGDTRLAVKPSQTVGTVDLLATTNATHLALLLANYEWVGNPIEPQTATVVVNGVPASGPTPVATLYTIDETNANPAATWRAQGKPDYPTESQIAALMAASEMGRSTATYTRSGNTMIFENIKLPPHSVAAIYVKLK